MFGVVIIATSVIIASNAFRVSAGERTKQFGLLKSIGATKKQITAAVVYEGVFLCVVGIPLGLLLGNAIHLIGAAVTETLFTQVNASGIVNSAAGLHFSYVFSWEATALAVIVSFFTVLVSAWLPARKAAKISPIDAIRQSGEIEVTGKSVKLSPLTKRLFGCEGALAAKYVNRSRRSYRATVRALCISIVLFMAGSFFGSVMESSMSAAMPYAGVTAVAEYISAEEYRLSPETVELVADKLAEFPGAVIHVDEKKGEDGSTLTGWLVETEDSAGFMAYAESVLEDIFDAPQNGEYSFNTYDASTITAGQRALSLAVWIFMFGFIALLVMIAVVNIVSTVVTNIRLRTREFALLRGIGMSKKNLSKMLRYEGLLSSVRALLFGIPIGSALVAALYFDAMQSAEFPFEYPWLAVLISVVGVLAIVFATTRIAERNVSRLSVIEALRE
jgi:ABC-type antimicrobial peptide transport system permease subunit